MQINEKDGFMAILELLGARLMFVKFHIHQPLTGGSNSSAGNLHPIFYYQLINNNK